MSVTMITMLILLDHDGLVVGTLPYDEPPDTVMLVDDGTFEYEGRSGNDYVYRQVEQ